MFLFLGEYTKKRKEKKNKQQHNNRWNLNLRRTTVYLLCCVCTAFSQSHFKPKLTFQWTWGPPPLPVRSKRSLLNVERSLSWFPDIFEYSLPLNQLCSALNPFTSSASKHKHWQHADMKLPFLCLLSVMMKFTHSLWLTHRKCSGERAAHVLSYKLCYLLSLLWEVDLRLSVCNER